MLQEPQHVHEHVDDYLHELLSPAEVAYVERHCEGCPTCRTALDDAQRRLHQMQIVPAYEASDELVRRTSAAIDDADRKRRRFRWRFAAGFALATAASVLLLLSAGHYFANLRASNLDLRVLGQTTLLSGSKGALRVQLADRRDGKPRAGVPVDVELVSAEQTLPLASFTTNEDGTYPVGFDIPDEAEGKWQLRVTARPPGERAEVLESSVRLVRSWKLMLSSDKPVYQPGQSIQLRALALKQPDLQPRAGQTIEFSIADPRGNLIFKQEKPTSKFGIVSAECPLATEILEGGYTITCRLGDTTSRRRVEVGKYVLPKYKVNVTLDRDYYQPGQEISGSVQVDYFFGKPVAGAAVQVTIAAEHVIPPHLQGPEERDGPDGIAVERVLARPEMDDATLTLRTDAQGQARFRHQVPAHLVGREQHAGDARITIAAQVTDTAGQKQSRSVSRVVTHHLIRILAVPEGGVPVQNVVNKLYLFATYPDGKPVSDAVISIEQTLGQRAKLEASELRTDKLGLAVCEVTPRHQQVQLRFAARDNAGREGNRVYQLFCNQAQHDFLVRPDQAVYTAGDTMHLLALGGGPGTIYLDILRAGQTVLTDTIEMKNGKGEYHFDIPADLVGTLELCAYRFGEEGLPIRRSRALYVKAARQIGITTTLDRPEYRPGEAAKIKFRLTDAQGKPAPGALSLAAVDEAVFSVLTQAPGMERTFFTLERELLKPIYTVYPWDPAVRPNLPEVERNRFEQGLFARTAQFSIDQSFRVVDQGEPRMGGAPDMAIAMREVEAGPPTFEERLPQRSQYSLTGSTFQAKVRQAAQTRARAYQWIVGGWAVLIGGILLTIYGWLWALVRPVWMVVGHVLIVPALLGLMWLQFVGIDAAHRFEAGAEMAMADGALREAMPTAAPPGGVAGAVRVRQEFPETLLWLPELITDDEGNASLDLRLADSITSWRLTASAVDALGHLGSERTDIKVFQPFFVDLDLPVSLTRNDEVTIPVTVYNYLKQPQVVTVELEQSPWFELQGKPKQQVALGPNEVRSVPFRIRALHVGKHSLQVAARSADVADAIKRPIEVVPDGRKVEQIVNDRLKGNLKQTFRIPENAVPESYQILVKVYPGVLSQVIEGLDGMLRMPNGCFEQTSSSAYPNILIIDYLKKTHTASPEVRAKAEQYLQLGYQRLLTFERPGGGFDWWGRDPAIVWLSAYGLQEFNDMSKVMNIDTAIIDRTQTYLMNQQNGDGSWDKIGATHGETIASMGNAKLLLTSYIVWGLLDSGMPADNANLKKGIDYILDHLDDAQDNTYVLAMVGNALATWNASDARTKAVLDTLCKQARQVPDSEARYFSANKSVTLSYAHGRGADVETTALAALALMKARTNPALINHAVDYLIKAKQDGGTWGTTQATILSLKVLIAGIGMAQPQGDVNLTVALNGAKPMQKTITAKNSDVVQLFELRADTRIGDNELTLAVEGDTNLMYQVVARHYEPWAKPEAKPGRPLGLTIDYDRRELTTKEVLKARATLKYHGALPTYMVMVDLGIPPGFQPNGDEFETMLRQGRIAKYSITARQVILYLGDVRPDDVLTFDYTLKPRFPLKAQAPASVAYEYNNPTERSVTEPVEITVK